MFRVTRHGFREMLIGSLVLVAAISVIGEFTYGTWLLLLVLLPVAMLVWLFAFFRDPERPLPVEQDTMVSPADGTVSDITELANHEVLGGPAVRVGIFLSVFNVHVNRSPCDGKVIDVKYKHGRFVNAMKHNAASETNESNTVVLADTLSGKPIAIVKQIVGLIARRIICTVDVGDAVTRGQRIGMIKFGSRTELYIPKSLAPQIKVSVGQTVRGAADVIAVLGNPIHTQAKRPVDGEEFEPLIGRETPA
jgi:phosphatidylserine decarboxylase